MSGQLGKRGRWRRQRSEVYSVRLKIQHHNETGAPSCKWWLLSPCCAVQCRRAGASHAKPRPVTVPAAAGPQGPPAVFLSKLQASRVQ